jgi:hypothetical protein
VSRDCVVQIGSLFVGSLSLGHFFVGIWAGLATRAAAGLGFGGAIGVLMVVSLSMMVIVRPTTSLSISTTADGMSSAVVNLTVGVGIG